MSAGEGRRPLGREGGKPPPRERQDEQHREEELDEALDESFPASDPPSPTQPREHSDKKPEER
ncbi:MAG TPA: hypothetical protein VLC53_19650 [Myxococcota bacterium]|nr:hypothetical protein [Myxococcota bacterium]